MVNRGITMGTSQSTQHSGADTLYRKVGKWVARDPDAVAVKDLGGRSMTYGEVSRRADAIGLTLHTMGARTGSRVAVFCEPTVDTVATIFAIHRIGAAYVPLDVHASDTRLHDILDESGASILVHHKPTATRAEALLRRNRPTTVRPLDLAATANLKVRPLSDSARRKMLRSFCTRADQPGNTRELR